MAKIIVDHKQVENAASAIDAYVSKHKANMKKINQSVIDLNTSWQGEDYQQLWIECQELSVESSTSGLMLKSMENYADYLRFAAKKYKDAQSNAVNRASRLPNY